MRATPIVLLLTAILLSGCLSKTVTVTSTPPGAVLSINDVEIGPTPATTEWHGGGVYRFHLQHKGYTTLKQNVTIKPRWYSYPIIDMGPDFMTTKEVKDHRELHFEMQPRGEESPEEIKQKALTAKAELEKL